MNERLRIGTFFLIIFALLFFLGRIDCRLLSLFGAGAYGETYGTMFHYLVSGPNPVAAVVGEILGHQEGPLQSFILMNAYCYTIGDIFPLNPATMQFPNTVFAFLTCVFAFLLGRKLFSDRLAYCLVLIFALSPWLAFTLRVPWYFNTMSCLLHFAVFPFLCGPHDAARFKVLPSGCSSNSFFLYLDRNGLADVFPGSRCFLLTEP